MCVCVGVCALLPGAADIEITQAGRARHSCLLLLCLVCGQQVLLTYKLPQAVRSIHNCLLLIDLVCVHDDQVLLTYSGCNI